MAAELEGKVREPLKKHPSGRPIRSNEVKSRSQYRVPQHGYELPRLRQEYNTTAIGFGIQRTEVEDE